MVAQVGAHHLRRAMANTIWLRRTGSIASVTASRRLVGDQRVRTQEDEQEDGGKARRDGSGGAGASHEATRGGGVGLKR